jgi:para-aminobenzoate synthetase component I
VIRLPAPALEPHEAARRVAEGQDPVWLTSPGAVSDTSIELDLVAADPVEIVRGTSVAALAAAWDRARQAWQRHGKLGDADAGAAPSSPARARDSPADPPIPMAVGWLSYDLARQWGPSLLRGGAPASAELDWPAIEFRFFDAVWMRRRDAPRAFVFARDADAGARLVARLSQPGAPPRPAPRLGVMRGQGTRADYLRAVARIQEYLRAGDVYQVNLSRRLRAEISPGDPLWLAAALRARTPAPHAIWMGARSTPSGALDRFVVGNSPERFLRVEANGRIETRPIKGTRARGEGPAANQAARLALAASAKDRAEHVMIVDLERNDLGRVAVTGSVVCEDLLRVVELPTMHHLVSTIRAQLRPGLNLDELLRATFPGGSITGAPKRRAMEIIDELEPDRRGLYTGATGWLGAGGELDLAVAIRTATIDRGVLSLSVGGGIVSDSVPDDEWAETETKARAFLQLTSDAPKAS